MIPQPTTKLLVSVRDVEEAKIAIEAGVDLVDLKEPNRGALGAVDLQTARDVVALRDGSQAPYNAAPLSMALGELSDYLPEDKVPGDADIEASLQAINLPTGIRYYKIGLADCVKRKHWREQLEHFVRRTIRRSGFVAVVYADHEAVAAPSLDEVLAEAMRLGARAVLIDTAVKDGRTLLDHWSRDTLRNAIRAISRSHLLSVVGGGLQAELIPDVARCHPDYVAVRGAACPGGRDRKIDAERIAKLRAILPHDIVRTACI